MVHLFLTCLIQSSTGDKSFLEKKYDHAFTYYIDINGDEKWDVQDSDILLDKMANFKEWPINGEKYNRTKDLLHSILDNVILETGSKNVGYVTSSQWSNICKQFAQHHSKFNDWQKNYITLYFNIQDKNEDGVISKDEFVAFFTVNGVDSAESTKAYNLITKNGTTPLNTNLYFELWKEFFGSDDVTAIGNYLGGRLNIHLL